MNNQINININFDLPENAGTDGVLPGETGGIKSAPVEIGEPIAAPIIKPFPLANSQDRLELAEVFEQKTTGLDRLYDAFGKNDTRVFGQDGKIVLDAGRGSDKIHVRQSADGGVDVSVNGKKYHFTAEQAAKLEIRGGSGNDSITVDQNVKHNLVLKGGSGNDTIRGGGGNDKIYGGSGNDRISGGAGNDYINGGTGNDRLNGNHGSDVLHGGSGRDRLDGGHGNDRLYGGRGNDTMIGGRGRDSMIDNKGFNRRVSDLTDRLGTFRGMFPPPTGGDNFFNPHASQFNEIGDLINQLFDSIQNLFNGADSNVNATSDFFNDFESFLNENQNPLQNFNNNFNNINPFDNIVRGLRDFNLRLQPSVNPAERNETPTTGMDRLYDRFNVDDTSVNRRFDGKLVIDAGRGNDRINVTNAGDGGLMVQVNDKSYYVSPEDAKNLVIKGGSGHDNITVAPNVKTGVTILGGSGNDRITGGGGNDKVYGGSGNDRIAGGKGHDHLHGGTGRDELRGGRGRDTLVRDNNDSVVDGGRDRDRVVREDGLSLFELIARKRQFRA